MTSRFQQSYVCLNGPKEGHWIDAPGQPELGSACAVPWAGADGVIRYAVYVLTEHEVEGETRTGLMYIQSHAKPEKAQDHVHRLTTVIQAAKMAADQVS